MVEYRDGIIHMLSKFQGQNITQNLEVTRNNIEYRNYGDRTFYTPSAHYGDGTLHRFWKLQGWNITHDLEITGMESCQISKVNCQFQTNWWLQIQTH